MITIPTNKPLTIKQEKFVQNLFLGMSQREAYKNSYNAKNMKDKTIDERACELFKNGKVRARYEELLKKMEDEAIMNVTERMKLLSKIATAEEKEKVFTVVDGKVIEAEVPAKLKTRINALDVLNKMDGIYTTKIEGNLDVTIEVGINED